MLSIILLVLLLGISLRTMTILSKLFSLGKDITALIYIVLYAIIAMGFILILGAI